MKILVIGLGSMGKRRIRILQALGYQKIFGFDLRKDRCAEAENKYSIETYCNFEEAVVRVQPTIFIISTPPDVHMHYAYYAYQNSIDTFIEASVVDAEKILTLSNMMQDKNFIIVPSCTMRYFPFVKNVKKLLYENVIGQVMNINYHVGQYLPDWHTWEDIKDFYVSNYETGAAREILPFELTWLNFIFGDPKVLFCVKKKLTSMDIDIDDIYHAILEYPSNVLANLTIEVISRPKVTRELQIIGSTGKITYSQDDNILKYINIDMDEWEDVNCSVENIERNYIYSDDVYVEEIQDFIESVKLHKIGKKIVYFNTLIDDYKVLQTLYMLESLSVD